MLVTPGHMRSCSGVYLARISGVITEDTLRLRPSRLNRGEASAKTGQLRDYSGVWFPSCAKYFSSSVLNFHWRWFGYDSYSAKCSDIQGFFVCNMRSPGGQMLAYSNRARESIDSAALDCGLTDFVTSGTWGASKQGKMQGRGRYGLGRGRKNTL